MSKNQDIPITQVEFDSILPRFRHALEDWWANESQSFDAAVAGTAASGGTASVWAGLPEIDSKAVVKASPVIRAYIGIDLDPTMIRKGGYDSFDDLAGDLLPKLRAKCSASTLHGAVAVAPTVSSNLESINARKR